MRRTSSTLRIPGGPISKYALLSSAASGALTAIPVDHRRRFNEPAVDGVVRDERRRRVDQVVPVRADMLNLNRRRLPDRVPVDLPQHVQPAPRRLEARRVDHAAIVEVADERGRVRREGPCGVRRGRDPDAVVVARPGTAARGVCGSTGLEWSVLGTW